MAKKSEYVVQYRYHGDRRVNEIRHRDLVAAMAEYQTAKKERAIQAVQVVYVVATSNAANSNQLLAGKTRKTTKAGR